MIPLSSVILFSFHKNQFSTIGFSKSGSVGSKVIDKGSICTVSKLGDINTKSDWLHLQISDIGSMRETWDVVWARDVGIVG